MIDLEGIKAFIAVAETRSFSMAAGRLHLTQPAVSKRIALLESQMKVRLFDRIGRTVNLTEAGRELAPRARHILTSIEDTHRAISNLSGEVTGQLALATSHHIGLWRLPNILRRYTELYPQVNLDLRFMDSEVAHEQIVQGNLELGVITLAPTQHNRLTSTRLWVDELKFVCSPEHPLASSNEITLETLSRFPAILPDMSTFTGRIVKQLFETESLSLNVSMSTNYLETIKMLIGVGLGWSVLPKSMLDSSLQILNLPGVEIHRDLGVIHHVQRTLSNAANSFLKMITLEQELLP
ncbi:MAG: DNA-binding transcriptional LysR family regulator [Candidatus Azotimanducaceae bacterium]|jgi:DNA-binding transcriptional LysR family regulator